MKEKVFKPEVVDDSDEDMNCYTFKRYKNDKLFSRHTTISLNLSSLLSKFKIAVAVLLDAVDIVLGNIPLLNGIWDFVTFFVLLLLLKNKYLAYFSLTELFIPSLPILGQIDALIPMATILTLIDIGMERNKMGKINKN